jgi:hypothetical protein
MSFSTPDASLSLAGIGSSSLPIVSEASLPADIRNGGTAAKTAYDEGLEFEQVLVNQLSQQLAATVSSDPLSGSSSSGSDGSSDDSSDGSDTSGLLSGEASPYASLIPQAITQSLMSSGGLGSVADEIARAIDPKIGEKS